MQSKGVIAETSSVRLVVDQHSKYRQDTPEGFDWEQVINPKVAAIALNLVQDIKDRRADWSLSGRRGTDPDISGLQAALRIIARQAVWCVQSEQQLLAFDAKRRGSRHADYLSADPRRELRNVSVPTERAAGVQSSRRGVSLPLAGP
jgi:hypothetical protein